MSQLTLSLLGPFQGELNGVPLTGFRTQKVQALLIILAAEPQTAHRREQLMTLLWPGMPEPSARANLRQILFHLHQSIPDFDAATPLLITNRHTIQLNSEADVSVDVGQFAALLTQVQRHDHVDLLTCHACYQMLQTAVTLYRGDFMADFYLDDSNEFEEWAQITRQRYRRNMLDALDSLTTIATRRAAYAEARTYAEQQLTIDNLHESAYRQLMEILALSGQRAAALALYESCRRLLMEELGMAPTTQTTGLYERIQAGELSLDQPSVPGVRGYELKEEIGAGAYGVIHRAMQPAIGREVAVKIIHPRYANDPAFIRRFEMEAQTIARLEHPHIVPLYDYWREPGGAYLVMRLLRGGNLLTRLQHGPWTPERTRAFLDQIAAALHVAHQQGIVHRDIKPGNILFDERDNAYLADFGIAKDLAQERPLTNPGDIVGTLDYISPEQLQAGNVTPQSDIYSLGAVLYEMLTGEKPFANQPLAAIIQSHLSAAFPLVSQSQPGIPAAIDEVIQRATAKRPQDRFPSALALAEMFAGAVNGRTLPTISPLPSLPDADTPNPYKGLRAYQEADAHDFYGRETLVAQLTNRLAGGRFLAIVGPSGSGKSSVVKAGLIPALRQGALPDSDTWYIAQMTPGTHPLEELELALWPIAVNPPPSLIEPMQKDSRGMLRTIRRILPEGENAQLLLVIDQFEELFTMTDATRRTQFLESLYTAVAAARSPLRVVVTLRADFYDRPLQYQPLADLFKQHTELVLALNRDELIWAIQEPARRVGIDFEDGLLADIVADMETQPGALPLLQYALTELFNARRGRQMTRQAYATIGGVPGALARRADEIFHALSPQQQAAARQMLLRLVTPGADEGAPDTRRRVRLPELEGLMVIGHQLSVTGEENPLPANDYRSPITDFGSARLLTFDRDPLTREPTVEVAHEALLHRWERLRGWIAQSRADIHQQRQLASLAAEWESHNRDDGFLLRGARLTQFEAWQQQNTLALLPLETAFLQVSLSARVEREAAEAARQQRELEIAQQLAASEKQRAEEQTRTANQLRSRALYLTGALIIAGILAIVALLFGERASRNEQSALEQQAIALAEAEQRATAQVRAEQERTEAQRQAQIAFSRELAAAALAELDIDPERSILLALEGLSVANTLQAENALHDAILLSRVRHTFSVDAQFWGTDYSPDGRYVATSDHLGGVIIWDVATGEAHLSLAGHEGYVSDVDFSNDGSLVASAGDDNSRIWDAATGKELVVLDSHTDYVIGISFSADDRFLVTSSADGTAVLWDVGASLTSGSGQQLHTLSGHTDWLWKAKFSPDGQRVATASSDGTAKIWDVASGEELLTLQVWENLGEVDGVVFSPDGAYLVTVGGALRQADISIWDTTTGERLYQLLGHNSTIQNVALSPDGSLLATGGVDGTAKVWDFSGNSREALITLSGHTSWINDLAFSPDGKYLVTASRDGTARIWDISFTGNAEVFNLFGHTDEIAALEFSPDGTYLATVSDDRTVRLWDIPSGQTSLILPELPSKMHDIAFDPSGTRLVTLGENYTAIIWDAHSGRELLVLTGHEVGPHEGLNRGIFNAAFSPDGTLLATAGSDGQAKIWNTATGHELLSLAGHPDGKAVHAVAFSPDGKWLATGSDHSPVIIKIWRVENGEELFTIPARDNTTRIWRIAFSPEGDHLAIADVAGGLEMWQLPGQMGTSNRQTPQRLFSSPSAHTGWIQDMNFSPDGTRLVTASSDRTAKVWDAATGLLLLRFNHPDGVTGAVINVEGTLLATTSVDGLVRLFTLDLGKLVSLAQSRVTRSLNTAECQQYLHVDECPAGE